jgi:hypothetical protein
VDIDGDLGTGVGAFGTCGAGVGVLGAGVVGVVDNPDNLRLENFAFPDELQDSLSEQGGTSSHCIVDPLSPQKEKTGTSPALKASVIEAR